MCDYGRLNYYYLESENRLLEPSIRKGNRLVPSDWKSAIAHAATLLRALPANEIAIVASGRMTNEELWLTMQFASSLGVEMIDIVPRTGPGDDILLSRDRNPNSNGAIALGVTAHPGAALPAIARAINSGQIKALIALGENPIGFGVSADKLSQLTAFVVIDILSNAATELASVVLPASGFAEKRGSMINRNGRLQRLNRAVRAPGQARDDWEILRDLLQAIGASNGLYSIEDVFRQMADSVPRFSGLSLSRIGDLGVQIMERTNAINRLSIRRSAMSSEQNC